MTNKKIINRYLVVFPALLMMIHVSATQTKAQRQSSEGSAPTLAWVNIGFGVAGGNDMSGLGLNVHAQYDSHYGLFGVRYLRADDTAVRTGFSEYLRNISEVSTTYGTSYNIGRLNVSASTGVGMVWGENQKPGNRESFRTISLPLQGSIILQPAPIVGIGMMLSTSINSESRVSGALFVLQLGRVR